MYRRLLLGIAAAIAVLVVAFWGAGSAVRAVGGGSISGTVYFDTDMDGQHDPGEKPAPGRTIELRSDDGELIDSDLTNRDGMYRVEEVLPDVHYWVNIVIDADTPCRNTDGFEYPPYNGILNADFGVLEKGTGSISGMVVEDDDEDGVRDVGEPGSEGWHIQLTAQSYSGSMYCDFNDVTDYSGRYGFTNLPLLPYQVEYWPEYSMLPWEATSPLDRDNPQYGPHYPLVDLRDKTHVADIDIGVHFLGGTSVVSGLAFRDLNLNKIRDEGEPILNCVVYGDQIAAYRETPVGKLTINNTMVNCQDAEFTLSGVAAGTYDIELYSWCVGPDAPMYQTVEGPRRSIAVADGQHSQPVEMNMCPQAAAWYPGPEPTPAPTPTVTILTMPDVGTGPEAHSGSSANVAATAIALLAAAGAIGLAFVLRQRPQRL